MDTPGGVFEYGVKAGDTTVLVRANKKGDNLYIYMFYPVTNSDKLTISNGSYNPDEWDSGVYTLNYINGTAVDVDLSNDGKIVSTY